MTDHQEPEDLKTPWTFKIMIVLVVIYLGWRLIQGIIWLWHAIF